jgi:SAM-dependent methyltransferase
MANEHAGLGAHSAEWFGDTRDHWWNEDYLRFLSAKWDAARIRSVLDVGCGVGHWSRLLGRVLPAETRFLGVDREAEWVTRATARASTEGAGARFCFTVGRAEALEQATGSFDLVTCQTLLIHLADPARGLAEMVRVAKPEGLVLVAEPTNLVSPVLLDALAAPGADPDVVGALVRFQLLCQRGKAALGEGDDLLGDRLPGLLAAAGLVDVELRLNDRAFSVQPPYDAPGAAASVDELRDRDRRELWCWPREVTRRYFVAGGGVPEAFDKAWSALLTEGRRVLHAIDQGRYATAGGGLFYVAWGRKPAG